LIAHKKGTRQNFLTRIFEFFSSIPFSASADFHPAFEANAKFCPTLFAASWASALFNQAVLAARLP
jgi:hypothetical protein